MLNRTNNGTVLNRDKRVYHITTEATTRSHINIKIHHHSKIEVSNNPTLAGDMKSPDLYHYQKIISIVLMFFLTRVRIDVGMERAADLEGTSVSNMRIGR